MAREQTLRIRVSEHEQATFEALAQLEKLPLGTFIRRRLLFEADQRGIYPRINDNRAGLRQEFADAIVSANN